MFEELKRICQKERTIRTKNENIKERKGQISQRGSRPLKSNAI